MSKTTFMALAVVGLLVGMRQVSAQQATGKYEPTWESLREHKEVPKWLRDGKFGIYTHWGPYAVHAYGENTTWYSFGMYADPDSEARKQ